MNAWIFLALSFSVIASLGSMYYARRAGKAYKELRRRNEN